MANIYGENYTKAFINNPAEQAKAGEYGGAVKVLFDLVAAGAGADVLHIGKLPKGSRVLAIESVNCDSPAFNVAVGEAISAETEVLVTLGAAPSFPAKAWVLYSVV